MEDLKDAMRKRDELRRSVIRFARAEIQKDEIASQATLTCSTRFRREAA